MPKKKETQLEIGKEEGPPTIMKSGRSLARKGDLEPLTMFV